MLDEVAHALKRENIEFHLLGYACSTLNDAVICHGAYSNQDLEKKLNDIAPDVMWFPAQWPETYSYTLSAALQYGLPVVVPNIGAFGERLIGRKFSRIINWDISFQRMSELWRQAIADFDGFSSNRMLILCRMFRQKHVLIISIKIIIFVIHGGVKASLAELILKL